MHSADMRLKTLLYRRVLRKACIIFVTVDFRASAIIGHSVIFVVRLNDVSLQDAWRLVASRNKCRRERERKRRSSPQMSWGHFRLCGGYFRGVSNDVSRDLRGCLSVSAKIDLTPHSLHHSAYGIGGASPSSCHDDDDDDRCDEAENAGTQHNVVRAISPGVATLAC